jgi:putative chitinase
MTMVSSLISRAISAAAPRADNAVWTSALTVPMAHYGITTIRRIAMFIGQVTEESGFFRSLEEDLHYNATRLCEVWPNRFPNLQAADPYVMHPDRLANKVYAGRLGNGDEASGDGWKYRGRGLIQITGRAHYEDLAKVEPNAADPDWLLTPDGAAASACWFWASEPGEPNLNAMADAWEITRVTERVNGALTGLPNRQTACAAALRACS